MPTLAESPKLEVSMGMLRRFSVAEYHQMIDAGVFAPGERVELLEGWIVEKLTRKPIHDATLQQVVETLMRHIPLGWSGRTQSAITALESEPEPDFAIVRGAAKDYRHHHPAPKDVGLIVEVADSSLAIDRKWKTRIYSRAGIPAYWIVNVVDERVETFSQPRSAGRRSTYLKKPVFRLGASIPLVLGEHRMSVPVGDLLVVG